MSVYSGFATRQQETKYNGLMETLLLALKKRVIKFYNGQACDEDKFKVLIKKIYKKMYILEKGKYMLPRYSTCFGDLIGLLGIDINYDSLSDASSIVSQSFTLKEEKPAGQQSASGVRVNGQFLKSRSILQSKKNSIEIALRKERGSIETLSASKFHKFDEIENRVLSSETRGASLDSELRSKALARLRLKDSKQLGQLRGTMHFPKMKDFLPKPEELPPQSFFESPKKNELKEVKEHRSFRRQKFSRSDMQIQEL